MCLGTDVGAYLRVRILPGGLVAATEVGLYLSLISLSPSLSPSRPAANAACFFLLPLSVCVCVCACVCVCVHVCVSS